MSCQHFQIQLLIVLREACLQKSVLSVMMLIHQEFWELCWLIVYLNWLVPVVLCVFRGYYVKLEKKYTETMTMSLE